MLYIDSQAIFNSYLYDLSPLDLDVLMLLIKHKKNKEEHSEIINEITQITLERLAIQVGRENIEVLKSLQKLIVLGLCVKKEVNAVELQESSYDDSGNKDICQTLSHNEALYSAVTLREFEAVTENRIKELETNFHQLLIHLQSNMKRTIDRFYCT